LLIPIPWLPCKSNLFEPICNAQVLEAISDHKEQLKPDSLQHLHALHNLASLLAEGKKLPDSTDLAEVKLRRDADLIREVGLSLVFRLLTLIIGAHS
jgi:hypothetical protein